MWICINVYIRVHAEIHIGMGEGCGITKSNSELRCHHQDIKKAILQLLGNSPEDNGNGNLWLPIRRRPGVLKYQGKCINS